MYDSEYSVAMVRLYVRLLGAGLQLLAIGGPQGGSGEPVGGVGGNPPRWSLLIRVSPFSYRSRSPHIRLMRARTLCCAEVTLWLACAEVFRQAGRLIGWQAGD